MLRMPSLARPNWQQLASEYGFHFHTMYGEPYWDESAYYQFTLQQIENHIEQPTKEIHEMCLHVVEHAINNEQTLQQLAIPEFAWQAIADSWQEGHPSLYSRLDFSYDGKHPAKLLENNADTPTSLYETGFWQWLWLENQVNVGAISRHADQFNSLQEKLVREFKRISQYYACQFMHFACAKDSEEDRATVQYLQDCASEAGLEAHFDFIEDIGIDKSGQLTSTQNHIIDHCFKLYPWEFMLREPFGQAALHSQTGWIEPVWKSVLSNKGLLPLLWQAFEGHPNLLPAFFEEDFARKANSQTQWVKKPLYSREGANISIFNAKQSHTQAASDGPYGDEGYIYQAYSPLPKFGDNYTLIGSWLVNNEPAGMSIREDAHLITQDMSRYLPHIIL
ncbi:MAG: glutathionylspermidine synthase family protein [Glaciecola sp.]